MTMLGGLFTRRTGSYIITIFFGAVMMTLGNGMFIRVGKTVNWAKIIVFQILTGTGAGVLFQTPMIAIQTHTQQKDMTAAMSAFSIVRSQSSSMSIVIETVLQSNLGFPGLTSGSLHSGSSTTRAFNDEKGVYVAPFHLMWAFFAAVSDHVASCGLHQGQAREV
ncbi:Efflux pump dotC [Colletotrichum spinosum]|uniref:Efflux pump dotC n=1 Tax=Colletotrichum spinosum TaxID=1347390 RepID=A0A4R8Q0U2_9PEZI|nr:Efflux pump dotC [Colletotrichum spinosum]